MKRTRKWIDGMLGYLGLAAIIVILWVGYNSKENIEPAEKYRQALPDWESSKLVDHFPKLIPANAKNLAFSSFPGFMQGGAHIQLRMELPPTEVKKLYNDAAKIAKQHHDGGNSFTLVNKRDDGLASTRPHTLDEGVYEFPEDYRIFILYAKPYKEGSDFDWNHGQSKGVIVSLQRNEVIYYAESW